MHPSSNTYVLLFCTLEEELVWFGTLCTDAVKSRKKENKLLRGLIPVSAGAVWLILKEKKGEHHADWS